MITIKARQVAGLFALWAAIALVFLVPAIVFIYILGGAFLLASIVVWENLS